MKRILTIIIAVSIVLSVFTSNVLAYDYSYEVGEEPGATGNATFANNQFEEALAEARATGGTVFLWEDFNMNNDRTNVIDVDIKALGDAQIVCGVNSTFEISGVIDAPLSSWGGSGFYIIINGTGTFKQEVRSYSNSLTINGGTFEGPVYAASSCPASIYGGTFLGRVYAETGEGKSASMRIYGGVFYDHDALQYMGYYTVAVKGTDAEGNVTYTVYPSKQSAKDSLPAGMILEITDDEYGNVYIMREAADADYVIDLIGSDSSVKGKYLDLTSANSDAEAGDTLRLSNDYTMRDNDHLNKELTIDLNGFGILSDSGYDEVFVDDGGTITVLDSSEAESGRVTAVIICTPENREGTVQSIDFCGGNYVIKSGCYFGAEGILNFNAGSFDGNIYLRGRGYGTYSFNGGEFTNFTLKVPGPGTKVWTGSDPYDHAKFYGGVYTPLEGDYDSLYEFISGHLGEGKNIIDVVPGTTFMVGEAEAEVNVEPSELTLYINEENKTFELKAEVTPKGLPVAWESSDPEIVTVDENGAVTAIAKGNATVTARVTLFVDGDEVVFEDTCEVTVAERMSPPPAPDPIKDEPEDDGKLPFDDVNEDDWYYEYVKEVYGEGLMKGVTGTQFAPNKSTTRGMIATIIHRLENCPESDSEMKFTDVEECWYYDAILWGAEQEILKGYSAEKFGPKDNITRQQLVTILYRYAVLKGYDTEARAELDGFEDADRVSKYAEDAMKWAVAEKLIEGSAGKLNPRDEAKRSEVAAVISRFLSITK